MKTNVLVTGVGGGGHGHEIVKALRLADRYHIIGTDMSAASFGFIDVDEAYVIPPASNPTYIDTLLDICRQKEVKVLLHGSEPELKAISRNRRRFQDAGILPLVNTQEIIDLGMDKVATLRFLSDNNFPYPQFVTVKSVEQIPTDFPLPAVVKPAVGGGGSANTFLVQEYDELDFACRYLVRHGQTIALQEYVGTPDDEYTVGVLHSLDGVLIGSIAVRRLILSGLSNRVKIPNRTNRSDLSPVLAISSGISQGVIEDFPEVRKACEAIATALGSRGPINIQCRFVDGTLYPFEINPRFSGTTYVRALMGFNEVDIMIRHHLLGEPLPKQVEYRHGQVIRGLVERTVPESNPVPRW